MSQGFTQNIPVPLPVSKGGSGVTTSTGTGNIVLSNSPTLTTPNIVGIVNASNANTGSIGEYIFSQVLQASGTPIVSSTATNMTSISLSAGDWDVYGQVTFTPSAGGVGFTIAAINTTSATLPDASITSWGPNNVASNALSVICSPRRMNLTTTTTVYIIGFVGITSGTFTQCGIIAARRVH